MNPKTATGRASVASETCDLLEQDLFDAESKSTPGMDLLSASKRSCSRRSHVSEATLALPVAVFGFIHAPFQRDASRSGGRLALTSPASPPRIRPNPSATSRAPS